MTKKRFKVELTAPDGERRTTHILNIADWMDRQVSANMPGTWLTVYKGPGMGTWQYQLTMTAWSPKRETFGGIGS